MPDSLADASPARSVWDNLEYRLKFDRYCPRKDEAIEIKQVVGRDQQPRFVLFSPRTRACIRIGEFPKKVFDLLDGAHTGQDISMEMALSGYLTSVSEVDETVAKFQERGFLDPKSCDFWIALKSRCQQSTWTKTVSRIAGALFAKALPIRNIDAVVTRLYGWLKAVLTNRGFIALSAIAGVAGMAAFVQVLVTRGLGFIPTAGSIGLGLAVLWILQAVHIALHELAHALTLKHFGGRIHEGGAMLYMGGIAFYVDATAAWQLPPAKRMIVSGAGPFASVLVGSLATLTACVLPASEVSDLLLKLAFLCYVSVIINLSPLLEFDGYYLLTDYLDSPTLRQDAFAWWWDRLRKRTPLLPHNRAEWGLAVFGGLSALWTVFVVTSSLYMWSRFVVELWQNHI